MIKKKEKRITNIELLKSINRSFSKVEEKIDTVDIKVEGLKTDIEGVKKDIEGVKNQLAGTNKRIDDFAETKVSKIEFKGLENRVGFMEKKLEIKK